MTHGQARIAYLGTCDLVALMPMDDPDYDNCSNTLRSARDCLLLGYVDVAGWLLEQVQKWAISCLTQQTLDSGVKF